MEDFFKVSSDITPWKINSPLERFLSKKADNSQFWKRLYVYYYAIRENKYHKNGRQLIKKEIARQLKNFDNFGELSDNWLKFDMIYSLHRFGVSFNEYFIYRFYDLNSYGRSKFCNLKLQYGYCERFNGRSVRQICENKKETFDILRQYYKRNLILIDNPDIVDVSDFKRAMGGVNR